MFTDSKVDSTYTDVQHTAHLHWPYTNESLRVKHELPTLKPWNVSCSTSQTIITVLIRFKATSSVGTPSFIMPIIIIRSTWRLWRCLPPLQRSPYHCFEACGHGDRASSCTPVIMLLNNYYSCSCFFKCRLKSNKYAIVSAVARRAWHHNIIFTLSNAHYHYIFNNVTLTHVW